MEKDQELLPGMVDAPAEGEDWEELLPGKTEGQHALVEALRGKWLQIAQEVRLSMAQYEGLQSQGVFAKVGWTERILVPRVYWERGAKIARTEHRAIRLLQLNGLAALVLKVFTEQDIEDKFSKEVATWDTVNLYLINEHVVLPLTDRFKCSLVDLVAEGEQRPRWFVSHWWGTPFKETIALLNWHAKCRELSVYATYWICTFANNQHQLDELGAGLADTPFVKAISDPECAGTCALFDAKATTFKRVWCILEGHYSTMEVVKAKPDFRYDLCGMMVQGFKGACLRMDLGQGQAEEMCEGNTVFPGFIAKHAMKMHVQSADASVDVDKRKILHYIADTPPDRHDKDPPQEHSSYDELNYFMRRGFAGQALVRAIKESDTEAMEAILHEFPEAVNFVSKRAGSIWDIAHRGNRDPAVLSIVEKASSGGYSKEEGQASSS
eukprot:TRINITY_DN36250_c0_g1_i1.p1 TRINITY_DN36250_c0_g1~~TRINITY_DN36250_c0_g1_i1.p1  ORF type:complete len:438 (-),score=97.43 TRINITY_DN36250_c0_g1_i1:150-1463(-)